MKSRREFRDQFLRLARARILLLLLHNTNHDKQLAICFSIYVLVGVTCIFCLFVCFHWFFYWHLFCVLNIVFFSFFSVFKIPFTKELVSHHIKDKGQMCFLLMTAENRCVWVYAGLCLKTIKETGAMAEEKRQTCWSKLHTEYESQLITIL